MLRMRKKPPAPSRRWRRLEIPIWAHDEARVLFLHPGVARCTFPLSLLFSITSYMAKRVRGNPATGHDPVSAIRLSTNLTAAIDKWAAQMGLSSRAQAIRRLIEFGLAGAQPTKRRAPKAAAKASKLAAQQIDKLADRSATAE